jgi:hypothetical protein
MAAKKVYVDLDLQSGSNVNIASNLAVTGTSTLATAILGQTILNSEVRFIDNNPDLNFSISPQTTSLYLTGSYATPEYSILSIAPSSGSFTSGKILDIYNYTGRYINIGASTYGNGPNSIIYNWSENQTNSKFVYNTEIQPNIYWNNNNSNIVYGGMLQIKSLSSSRLIYGQGSGLNGSDSFWRIMTTSSPYPSRIEIYIDAQGGFYTGSVSEVNVILSNPFDNTNRDFTVGLTSNSTAASPTAVTIEEIECIKKYTNDSGRNFNLTFNKSILESFRGSNQYIIVWIMF